jgi:cell division protein FtsL
MPMDLTLVFAVALAAAIIVVVLALVVIIIYQRWRIGDQNVFIERFIRQIEEQRQKMKKAGIL